MQSTSDNDGLWTSMYLASQSFRYAGMLLINPLFFFLFALLFLSSLFLLLINIVIVTKTPEAKASAWASFEAMELLNNISGVQGTLSILTFLIVS